jgi:hypothetical protein
MGLSSARNYWAEYNFQNCLNFFPASGFFQSEKIWAAFFSTFLICPKLSGRKKIPNCPQIFKHPGNISQEFSKEPIFRVPQQNPTLFPKLPKLFALFWGLGVCEGFI